MNNIDIYSENQQFESDYLPLISFKTQQQQARAEEYIFNKVDIFYEKIIKIKTDIKKTHIAYPKIITEKDFTAKDIKYFYENILFDLGKRNHINNKLDFAPKWGITFDEKCAPILMSWLSPKYRVYADSKPGYGIFREDDIPYYRYGTIDINGTPIFYYIYFTLQELLDVIK
ncbi:hypothetical protein H6F96_15050 [Microcoleus sp. FACHB-53]|nr:hypothetical protein [Microcoleus sp. FACHB-53]